MSALFAESVSAGLWIALKASILLGLTAVVQAMLHRRASAATRHLLWTLAIISVLLLPVVSVAVPEWTVAIPAPPSAVAVAPVGTRAAAAVEAATLSHPAAGLDSATAVPSVSRVPWPIAMILAYVAGVIVMLARLAVQHSVIRRCARRALVVRGVGWTRLLADCAERMGVDRPVRLLRSREYAVPMAIGTRRPSIVVPDIAETWADDRRRAVILHELAHVARLDCLTQTLAFGACMMYWFHPAVWWVARRMRVERELACDDRVIATGTRAHEYASHLLDLAYSLGRPGAPALSVSMARPRQLEGRLLAALDPARNRSVPALRYRLACSGVAALLLGPLAAATPIGVAARGSDGALGLPASAFAVPGPGPSAADDLRAARAPFEPPAGRLPFAATATGMEQDAEPGTWEIRPSSTPGTIRLRLVEVNSSSDSAVALERLEGLTAAQLAGEGGPVQFRLRRDAGTFTFEGVLRRGVGAGTFSFTPDTNFPAELAGRGFARPSAREQYQLARHDIGYAFVEELDAQGYAKPQTADLVRAGQHGVHATYLREMGALGYRLGSLRPLIQLRDHGVTPDYVRELAEQGYKGLPADELRRARDRGITSEYVRAMREDGYGSLAMSDLVRARDHGVTADFVRGLRDLGHGKVPLDRLIRVRDHGVTPEYVSGLRQLGYQLSLDELVRARDHGVDTAFVRDMAALGYSKLPMDSLIRLRDHGVTPEYARELKSLGYDQLSPDDLLTLRDYGLTPDRIRAANARAGTRLPVEALKSLAVR